MSIYDLHYSNPTYNMFFLLLQTSDLIYRILEERIDEEDEDITLAQLRLLLVLSRHNKPLTSAELSRYTFRKSQTITTTLSQLKRNGYVEVVGDRKDKRMGRVRITELGEQLLKKHIRWLTPAMRGMVSCLSKEELQKFDDYLIRLRYWLLQLSGMDLIQPALGFNDADGNLKR